MTQENQLKYHGNIWSIYKIFIVNTILKIITFFIYSPWAKTRTRRYIYGNLSIFNSKLEYIGRGGEIFKAYLAVSAIIMILSIAIGVMVVISTAVMANVGGSVQLAKAFIDYFWTLFIIFFLGYYAAFAGLGYKLSRTTWKGIKGKLDGKARSYAFFRLRRLILNILTLGLAIGRTDILARQYKMQRIALGQEKFQFSLHKSALDKINIITLILAIPTLSLSRIYYKVAMLRMFWNATSIENVTFKGKHSFVSVLWLSISNMLLIIFTLGFAIPVVIHRTARYFAKYIEISGSIEGSNILQNYDQKDARGEALDDLSSGVGLDLDIGLW